MHRRCMPSLLNLELSGSTQAARLEPLCTIQLAESAVKRSKWKVSRFPRNLQNQTIGEAENLFGRGSDPPLPIQRQRLEP